MKQLNFDLSKTPPNISQTFTSLEGEGNAIGQTSVYLRLGGCFSAACTFCDTKFSWGNAPSFQKIGDPALETTLIESMVGSKPKRMTITGGEPMHYLKWFPDIFKWVDGLSPEGLEHLGIESNGNLLSDKHKCMDLIKSFNHIINEYNVKPTLTISPKLDSESCYEGQLTQLEVDEIYYNAFHNMTHYLQQYDIYYKFIYQDKIYNNELMDFNHQQKYIDLLINKLGVSRKNILLMPFTPEDPLGTDKDFWEGSKDATSRKSLEIGCTYSPRIQVDRRLD